MIKNRYLTGLLAKASQYSRTRAALPLHEGARHLYQRLAVPLLERELRRRLGRSDLRLICRNSLLIQGGFNLFESDIDLSVIFPDGSLDAAACAKSTGVIANLRSVFPFIGELEIYEEWESKLNGQIRQVAPDLASRVLSMRKWAWQGRAFSNAYSSYHRQKAARSIQRIRLSFGLDANVAPPHPTREESLRLGEHLNQLIDGHSSHQPACDPSLVLHGRSQYLEWELGSAANFLSIPGPPSALLRIATVLPDGLSIFPGQVDIIRAARKDIGIARCLCLITLHEWLLSRTASRLNPGKPEYATWFATLHELLREHLAMEPFQGTVLRDLKETLFLPNP